MSNEQREVRLAKAKALREAGIRAWADRYPTTHRLAAARDLAAKEADGAPGTEVRVAGRVMTVRSFGPLVFLHLQDGSGRCQVGLDAKRAGEDAVQRFERFVDLGDFVGVKGVTGRTKKGEPTVWATEWTFLAKALRPLPEKWHGLSDVEARQRERYLDLVSSEETRERFRLRTRFVREVRSFLDANGFEEVETPILQTKASGALARPFVSHHNALDMDVVLRIAPETWLKQCVAGGIDRVYEIARCFRNEGMDPSHLQDFTMVEWYAAYWDYRDNMDFTQGMVLHLLDRVLGSRTVRYGERTIDFTPPWPRKSLRELIRVDCGIDYAEHADAASLRRAIAAKRIDLERDDLDVLGRGPLIDVLYKKVSRPKLVSPVFVTDHPIDLSPLARRSDEDPTRVDRFQLVVNGWEVVNAYSELVDPIDQRARFEEQAKAKEKGDVEALEVDEEYLRCMEHGMPPMSGWGMGVDRFVALLTNQETLRETVLFPLLKPLSPVERQTEPPTETDGKNRATPPPVSSPPAPSATAASSDLLGYPADDVKDLGITETRARALFDEWVQTPSLRRQMEMASKVMAALARKLGKNEEAWRLLGLLHNLDFDRVKEPERHCLVAADVFRKEGMHPSGIHAIAAHNDDGLKATGIRCESLMDHAVSCAEAVVGLVHAATQILPSKDPKDLALKSLRKRHDDKKFAATVERHLIARCAGLGLSLDDFLALALDALR